jgi:hypothetical protein
VLRPCATSMFLLHRKPAFGKVNSALQSFAMVDLYWRVTWRRLALTVIPDPKQNPLKKTPVSVQLLVT